MKYVTYLYIPMCPILTIIQYLVRIEQIGLHVAGAPQWYISCAQISITGGGNANPAKVSFPGYAQASGGCPCSVMNMIHELNNIVSDPGLTVNIYYPVPTSYTVFHSALIRPEVRILTRHIGSRPKTLPRISKVIKLYTSWLCFKINGRPSTSRK